MNGPTSSGVQIHRFQGEHLHEYQQHTTFTLTSCSCIKYNAAHLASVCRRCYPRTAGRRQKSVQVLFQLVNMPSSNYSRVKDGMSSMDHMIVNWDHHERLVSGDTAQNTGVERFEEPMRVIVHAVSQRSQRLYKNILKLAIFLRCVYSCASHEEEDDSTCSTERMSVGNAKSTSCSVSPKDSSHSSSDSSIPREFGLARTFP